MWGRSRDMTIDEVLAESAEFEAEIAGLEWHEVPTHCAVERDGAITVVFPLCFDDEGREIPERRRVTLPGGPSTDLGCSRRFPRQRDQAMIRRRNELLIAAVRGTLK